MQGNNLKYYYKYFLFLAIFITPLASSEEWAELSYKKGKQYSAFSSNLGFWYPF